MIHFQNFLAKMIPSDRVQRIKDSQFWSSDSKKLTLSDDTSLHGPVYPILGSASYPGSGIGPTGKAKHV